MKIGKRLIAFIIVIVIIAFVILNYYPSLIWDEGSPEGSVEVKITKVDETGQASDYASGSFDIDEDAIGTPVEPNLNIPLTITEVGTPFVEPDSQYEIEFFITIGATPDSPAVTEVNYEGTITGQTAVGIPDLPITWPVTDHAIYLDRNGDTPAIDSITNIPVDQSGVLEWKRADQNHFFSIAHPTDPTHYNDRIYGKYIHDSTFHIEINAYAVGDPLIFGSTQVDAILKVGAGGGITVEITDITTGVD